MNRLIKIIRDFLFEEEETNKVSPKTIISETKKYNDNISSDFSDEESYNEQDLTESPEIKAEDIAEDNEIKADDLLDEDLNNLPFGDNEEGESDEDFEDEEEREENDEEEEDEEVGLWEEEEDNEGDDLELISSGSKLEMPNFKDDENEENNLDLPNLDDLDLNEADILKKIKELEEKIKKEKNNK